MRQDLDDDSTSRILQSKNSGDESRQIVNNESPILRFKRRNPSLSRTENNENDQSIDEEWEVCLTKKSRTELDAETNTSIRFSTIRKEFCSKSTQTNERGSILLTKKSLTELDVETNAIPRLSSIRKEFYSKSTQTEERGSCNKENSFMEGVNSFIKRIVKKNFDLLSDDKPSPTPLSDRAQESITVETSGGNSSDSSLLYDAINSHQPNITENDKHIETTSSQKITVDEMPSEDSLVFIKSHEPKIEIDWDVEDSPIKPEYSISPINSQEITENDNHSIFIETKYSQLDISPCEENEDDSLSSIDPVFSQEVKLEVEPVFSQEVKQEVEPVFSQEVKQEVEIEEQNEEPPLFVIRSVFCQKDIPEFDFGKLWESAPIEDNNEIIFSSPDEDKPLSFLEARKTFRKRLVFDTKNDANTQGKIDKPNNNDSIYIETISSQMVNSSSNEESQALPIDDDDDDEIGGSSSDEDVPFSKLPRRKLKKSVALKFQSIANRCRSRRAIWEYQLRAAEDALERSDWPVFVVKEYVSKFNCSFMRCITEEDAIHSDEEDNCPDKFTLSNCIYILCDQNEREIGTKFKIHLPLLLLDHNHETYLLGGNRLELVVSPKAILKLSHSMSVESPKVESMKRSLSSSSSSSDMSSGTIDDLLGPKKYNTHNETDNEITGKNVVVMKNLDAFNNLESLGLIKLGSTLRCIISNPFVIGQLVGWAELPIPIAYHTNVIERYCVVLRDAARHNCAFGVSKEGIAKLMSLCENDEDKNKKLKIQGFRFTHVLPVGMLPELISFTPEESVTYKFNEVYFLT